MTTRNCDGCNDADWHDQEEPLLADTREQIIDPRTAYQIVSMLEGVVQRGTGRSVRARSASRWPARPAPRRMPKDVWFIGFSPDLACGVFVGFDNPRTLGPQGAGRHRGGADLPRLHEGGADGCAADAVPRRARHRGSADRLEERQSRSPPGTPGAIMEAFKAGTAPGEANAPAPDETRRRPARPAAPPASASEGTGGLSASRCSAERYRWTLA